MSDHNNNRLRPTSMADSEKTAAQSVPPSVVDTKDPLESTRPSRSPSVHKKSAELQGAQGTNNYGDDKLATSDASTPLEDDYEYPSGWKLAAITTALCLSVFCMALVRTGLPMLQHTS